MRCICCIAHVKWLDKVPNIKVLQTCGITGIEAFLPAAQFRWSGHVLHMADMRLLGQVFYGKLQSCMLNSNITRMDSMDLKLCNMDPNDLEEIIADKASSRAQCHAQPDYHCSIQMKTPKAQYLENNNI